MTNLEYTATEDDLRGTIAWRQQFGPDKLTVEAFDRWLAAVKAGAWGEGFRAGDEAATGHLTENPYRDTGVDHEEGANLAPRPKSAGRWRSRQEEA